MVKALHMRASHYSGHVDHDPLRSSHYFQCNDGPCKVVLVCIGVTSKTVDFIA